MAQRDKTQGFAFVYVDIQELLKKNRDAIRKERARQAPPAPAQELGDLGPVVAPPNVTAVNFNRDKAPVSSSPAARQIRENLDRLQALHHKLHAMLHELNQVTERSKKKQDN